MNARFQLQARDDMDVKHASPWEAIERMKGARFSGADKWQKPCRLPAQKNSFVSQIEESRRAGVRTT